MENKNKHKEYYYDYSKNINNDNKYLFHNVLKENNNIIENNAYLRPRINDTSKIYGNNKNYEIISGLEENKKELINNLINHNKNEDNIISSSESKEGQKIINKLKKENEMLKQQIAKREKLLETYKNKCIENDKKKNEIKIAIHNMKKYIKRHTSEMLFDDKIEEEMAIKAVENQIINELSKDTNNDHISYEQLLKIKDNNNKPGTSEEKISSIPEITFNIMAFGNVCQCMICMDEFKDQEKVKQIKCGHIFHKECLVQWILNQNNCPICNKEF